MMWRHLATIFLWLAVGCLGYPDGPPESACVDMMPGIRTGVVGLIGHLASPQNVFPTYGNKRTSPYYISVNLPNMVYSPGQEVHVRIVANQTAGLVMYKGVFLQARKVICASDVGKDNETILVEQEPIGTFLSISSSMLLKNMECGGVARSAICHRSPQFKIDETVTWVAPDDYAGHVVFRATIVQEAYIYWTNVHSGILHDTLDGESPRTCAGCNLHPYSTTLLVLFVSMYYSASYW